MELTFVTELGESFVVEIDENMELENVMALLEVEVSSVHIRTLAFDAVDHRCPYRCSCVSSNSTDRSISLPPPTMYFRQMNYRDPTLTLSDIVRHTGG